MRHFRRKASQARVLQALVDAGVAPFARPAEHVIATSIDDGPAMVIDLGPEARQRRILPSVARRKGRRLIEDFTEFARGRSRRTWRYWNFRPLEGKAPIGELQEKVVQFGKQIGNSVEYLRDHYGVDVFIAVIQVRMDDAKQRFDIHAHVICDVADSDEKAVKHYLWRTYAEVDAPRRRIKDVRRAVAYIVPRTYDHSAVPNWPPEALRAAWQLSGSRTQLIRSYGSFAQWRRLCSGNAKVAAKAPENKANAPRSRERAVFDVQKARYGPTVEFATKGIRRRFRIGYRAIPSPVPVLTTDAADRLSRAQRASARVSASAGSPSSASLSTIPKRNRGTPRINRFRKWSRPPAVGGRQLWWWKAWPFFGTPHPWRTRWVPRPIRRRLARRAIQHPSAPSSN